VLHRVGGPGVTPEVEPIVLRLQPAEEITSRQLVDTTIPSETMPPEPTDRIAEENALARDLELRDAEDAGPRFDREDPFDALAALAPAQPVLSPTPPTPETPESESAEESDEDQTSALEAAEDPDYIESPPSSQPEPELLASAKPPPPNPEMLEPLPQVHAQPRTQVAEVPRPGHAEFGGPESKGRSGDAVREMGLLNFEAIADQVAPYLKQVKQRVERRWNEALLNRYSGLTPTEAVIECAIAPDGTVVSAQIVGNPSDPIFAALCRTAILRAGPFGPFTFQVPDIYRNQNLEIRWTFSFL
jgi:hypothetical protein